LKTIATKEKEME
jgi:hypothetical protein